MSARNTDRHLVAVARILPYLLEVAANLSFPYPRLRISYIGQSVASVAPLTAKPNLEAAHIMT